jgi:anion-transporting  ArsA/GET3 family ATPase
VTTKTKSFEVFCGTGGVGKTTLATARALSLATKGLRVLLITIDPARRLKDLLGLDDSSIGEVTSVNINNINLDALLMSPEKTIQRMSSAQGLEDLAANRIVKILSRPYGGMNEILSLVELQMQFETGKYDIIILDTPPGAHFLDFLEGLNKIRAFFDQSFVELFTHLSAKTAGPGKKIFGMDFINRVLSSGLKKLLSYLEKVTDAKFIQDFIQAVQIIYQSKASFLKGLALQERLKSPVDCNWFLVTSVEQGKAQEALEMKAHATHFIHQDHYLVLNKCLEQELNQWIPQNEQLKRLKTSLESRETDLKNSLRLNFKHILEFPEIMSSGPVEHVSDLTLKWNSYDL